jgi:putative ABC transport system ATP-binding protein
VSGEALVRLVDVSHAYREGERDRPVLNGVQAQFSRGESIAIIGQSGSGKSTLLNLIGGIDLPDTGRIEVAGHDLVAMSERDRTRLRRARIGFVYQFFNLIPTLTVLENLCLPLVLNGRSSSAALVHAREMLAQVGLAERADSFPDVLSGGEQQRIALARALVHAPELILADEPTGNLDARSGQLVIELLTRLVRTVRGTLILVTHSESLAARVDRVLRMADGRLHEEGHARPAEAQSLQR